MLAGVPEVDDLGLGREALEEGPVVGGAVGHGADPDLRSHTPDMGDLARELCLQPDLATLGHAAEIEGLHPVTLGVVEGDRAAGGLAPARLGTAPLAGPQRHHDAVERDRRAHRVGRYVLGGTDAGQCLRGDALPALMHALGEALQRAHRRRHAAHLRELLRFTRRTVAHHHQPELRRRPGQVVVDEAQALVHRHQRRAGSAVAVAGTPKDHRTEGRHDRLRRRRHPEPALPVALDPARTVVPALGPGSKELATQAVHGLAQPRLNRLEHLRRRVRSSLIATEVDDLGHRFGHLDRQPGKIDGRESGRLRHWHGIAPDAGLYGVASYRISRCGAFPPTTPGCRQRDKIPPCSGRLSRNPDFGCLPQPGNIAKSMTYDCHARPRPTPAGSAFAGRPGSSPGCGASRPGARKLAGRRAILAAFSGNCRGRGMTGCARAHIMSRPALVLSNKGVIP